MLERVAGHNGSTGAGTSAATRSSERIEIVTRPEARRVYTAEEKVRLVTETLQPGETVQGVSRRHGVCASLLHRWRRAARGEAAQQRRPPQLLPVRLVAAEPEPPPAAPAPPAPPTPVTSAGAAVPIELVLRNGRVLRLAQEVDAAAVARLAAALEA
jgi:transposase